MKKKPIYSKKERFSGIIAHFSEHMPEADTELMYKNAFQLLVAVILSAQCTDKRVNLITPGLFNKFPDAVSLSQAKLSEVFDLIRSCSYPNNKAKHLIGMAEKLVHEFNNKVPADVKDLQKLPGVGRKTANVVASVVYNIPTMPVDTHVFRVSARIGLTTNAKTPLQAEDQLTKYFPEDKLVRAHHWLILHGRYVCTAKKPKCQECGITKFCKFFQRKR